MATDYNDSKTGPIFKINNRVRTYDDNDHRKGIASGTVTGISDEGFTVKWDDLEDETEYYFNKVTIQNDLIIEEGCPFPPITFPSVDMLTLDGCIEWAKEHYDKIKHPDFESVDEVMMQDIIECLNKLKSIGLQPHSVSIGLVEALEKADPYVGHITHTDTGEVERRGSWDGCISKLRELIEANPPLPETVREDKNFVNTEKNKLLHEMINIKHGKYTGNKIWFIPDGSIEVLPGDQKPKRKDAMNITAIIEDGFL